MFGHIEYLFVSGRETDKCLKQEESSRLGTYSTHDMDFTDLMYLDLFGDLVFVDERESHDYSRVLVNFKFVFAGTRVT